MSDEVKWEFYQNGRGYYYWRTLDTQGRVVSRSVGGSKFKEQCLISAQQAGHQPKGETK